MGANSVMKVDSEPLRVGPYPYPPRILVADVPRGVETIRTIAGALATVTGAHSLTEALKHLKSGPELVICGVHFDESRMFDLLRIAKVEPTLQAVPFLCFREIDSELSPPYLEGLHIACTALGAKAFVDLYQMKTRHSVYAADAQFRRIIERLLSSGTC